MFPPQLRRHVLPRRSLPRISPSRVHPLPRLLSHALGAVPHGPVYGLGGDALPVQPFQVSHRDVGATRALRGAPRARDEARPRVLRAAEPGQRHRQRVGALARARAAGCQVRRGVAAQILLIC
jgi:hypothetical protein